MGSVKSIGWSMPYRLWLSRVETQPDRFFWKMSRFSIFICTGKGPVRQKTSVLPRPSVDNSTHFYLCTVIGAIATCIVPCKEFRNVSLTYNQILCNPKDSSNCKASIALQSSTVFHRSVTFLIETTTKIELIDDWIFYFNPTKIKKKFFSNKI